MQRTQSADKALKACCTRSFSSQVCSCSLAFGFSAGGLLFPYYIGIMSGLDDLGITRAGGTHLAGASAGSLIAGCYHAGIPVSGIMDATMELIAMVSSP